MIMWVINNAEEDRLVLSNSLGYYEDVSVPANGAGPGPEVVRQTQHA